MSQHNTSDLIRAQVALSNKKSMGAALALTFFFGPLGLFYASVIGGIVMLIVTIVVAIFTLGIGLLITQPICLIWAGLAVSGQNSKIDAAVVGATVQRDATPPTA